MAAAPRPYDTLGRPPANPIRFPIPKSARGGWVWVLCINESTGEEEWVGNVLLRTIGRDDSIDPEVQYAYCRIPKEPITTNMGHVEFCRVLKRRIQDDRIVFQWTDRIVAVKVNNVKTMTELRRIGRIEDPLQEIAAMQLLGETPVNVLGAMEVLLDGQNFYVIMRFCQNGDLFQLLEHAQQRRQRMTRVSIAGVHGLTEGEARYWFRQVMNGVQFLHEHGICHRDLSPENIVIDVHESFIIDMGMCLRIPYPSNDGHAAIQDAPDGGIRCLIQPQGRCGKLPYMSPEVFTNSGPFDGHAIDVWTCGTILFFMLIGQTYERPDVVDRVFVCMTNNLEGLLAHWKVNLSTHGVALLKGMLQVDPRERLTVEEIITHPWFNGPVEAPMPAEA